MGAIAMSRTLAIARRILSQFAHDKRTLGLLFVAPLVVLWLLSVLLGADAVGPAVATVDLPESFMSALEEQDVRIRDVSAEEAQSLIDSNEVAAVLRMRGESTLEIYAEGSNSTQTAAVVGVVSAAFSDLQKEAADQLQEDMEQRKADMQERIDEALEKREQMRSEIEEVAASLPDSVRSMLPESLQDWVDGSDDETISVEEFQVSMEDYLPVQDIEITYLHGSEDWLMFDFYGPIFIGLFLFVFVFITSGMSLVNERSAGTMERFLATPVKPLEILGGYTIGFGALALVQAIVILAVSLTLIGFPNEGSLALVVLVAVSLAIASVTLGLLVSGLASSPFQVIQLMLLFVVPQILLCGIFDLAAAPDWLQALSRCLPLTYGVDALQSVMLRGADFNGIWFDLAIVWGFIAAFFILAALRFRKKRARSQHAL